jgi:murein DD-endopeptidase MepM/ murein hydrolase activator NlpD
MKRIFLFLTLTSFLINIQLNGQAFLNNPIEGIYGRDYIIVNYVDWGLGNSIKDNHCSSKTYNGHQGTDYVIRNFKKMDSGVYVLAAAAGRVNFVKDGEFDRNKVSDTSKKLGNYIGLSHSNGYQTYYGHLKKNSILVSEGEMVTAGQRIAKVGSSGNSSDPHLHFEVWYDSLFYVDPYRGNCGNSNSLFVNTESYDSSFNYWIDGLCNFIPNLDTLREQPNNVEAFTKDDLAINYWSILYGLRKGDSIHIEWYAADESLWFKFPLFINKDYWYYYYWSFIDVSDNLPIGTWKVLLKRNNQLVNQKEFRFGVKLNNHIIEVPSNLNPLKVLYKNDRLEFSGIEKGGEISIYNKFGQLIKLYNNVYLTQEFHVFKSEYKQGLYVLKYKTLKDNQIYTVKFIIN